MEIKTKRKILVSILKSGIFFLFLLYFLTNVAHYNSDQKTEVLGIDSELTVQAEIGLHTLLWIKPQNRIPSVDNDSLAVAVEVRQPGTTTVEYSDTLTVNNQGYIQMQPLSVSQVPVGVHDVAIKGLSHLRRTFPSQSFGPANEFALDLRSLNLLAGDTHPTADNYINSLDISYEILHLYSSDLRGDLNRDGKVNSLELPTLISNINKHGDI